MISVVGPTYLDVNCEVTAVSVDQALPVLKFREGRTTVRPGAAGYVASLLGMLGYPQVDLYTYLPQTALLHSYMENAGVKVYSAGHSNGVMHTKTRYFCQNHLVVRADSDEGIKLFSQCPEESERMIEQEFKHGENPIIVVCDYGKGFFDYKKLRGWIQKAKKSGRTIIVDPQDTVEAWGGYRGATYVTPNEAQFDTICREAGVRGRDLVREAGVANILLTRGTNGIHLMDGQGNGFVNPAKQFKVNLADPTGAGDAFVAGLALSLTGMMTPLVFDLPLATAAAACRHPSTSPLFLGDVYREVYRVTGKSKIITHGEANMLRRSAERNNLRFGFTNGVFDMLHAGHVKSLKEAKANCDVLVVAVNSDESTKAIKPGRPIDTYEQRVEVLASLDCVDFVIALNDAQPENLLRSLYPDIYFKGKTNIANEKLPGVSGLRMKIHRTEVLKDGKLPVSTTRRIERLEKGREWLHGKQGTTKRQNASRTSSSSKRRRT